MSENNTQLTPVKGYDTKRMIFSDPQKGTIPNSTISYQRIGISTLNEDGSTGDLVLPTTELFSFGVSENKDMADPTKINGYVLPICLWSRDGPTDEEKQWTETFNTIVDSCKEHILQNKEELELDIVPSDLRKFNPLYWKKEKGKILEDRGPTLYVKLIQSKKKGQTQSEAKTLSMFFNENEDSIDAMDLLGKYCFVKAAVKIESIFIGSKISLQIKLYEATVRLMTSGMKRLLPRKKESTRLISVKSNPMLEHVEDDKDVDSDAGSAGSIDTEEKKPPTPKKRVVKKVVRKVKKATA